MNHLVKEGGSWINFGSLAFTHSDIKKCYSRDEFMELLEECGWKVESKIEREIPYLCSPHSGQKRFENVLTFRATKVKDVAYEPSKYSYLPDWLTRNDIPIPEIPVIQNLVLVNYVFAELLSAVGSGSTMADLGAALAPKLNLPPDQGTEVLRSVLTRVYEENMHTFF